MEYIVVALIFFLIYILEPKKKSQATKQVNSFSKNSCSEWSHSDISCSSDSGVVNITITSRR